MGRIGWTKRTVLYCKYLHTVDGIIDAREDLQGILGGLPRILGKAPLGPPILCSILPRIPRILRILEDSGDSSEDIVKTGIPRGAKPP